MRLWRLTDEQFIARVRSCQRARRYVGATLFALGIVAAGMSAYCGKQLSDQALESDPVRMIEQPTKEDVQLLVDEPRFYSGLTLGFVVGQGLWSGTLLVIIGFGLVTFRDRKSHLLLKCWARQSQGA